jgi:NifB/MoaA-like Fe-S oxidoreductase
MRIQKFFRREFGSTFVYLADEFYLRANLPFPPSIFYDGFPQLENGIGLTRLFYDEFHRCLPLAPRSLHRPRRFFIATGTAGARVLRPLVARLNRIKNLDLELIPIPNTFFGSRINVTGLLTGKDLLWGLKGLAGADVLLPRVLLRRGSSLFLDGSTLAEVGFKLGCNLHVIEPTPRALLEAIL